MREILFRGKRTDTGEWVEGDLFHNLILDGVSEKETRIGDVYFYGDEIHGTALYMVMPETVGQYTGLTDKNGKRIFEGDIIKHAERGWKYEVAFDYGAFGTVTVYPLGGRCVFAFYDSEYGEDVAEYKVIGNIHDNPELLT